MSIRGKLEALAWRFRVNIVNKLKYRLSPQEKRALNGEIPMTRDIFWSSLNIYYLRLDMQKYWAIWHGHPEYVNEWRDKFNREMADPDSKLCNERDVWWADLRPKLVEYYGEYWVKDKTDYWRSV